MSRCVVCGVEDQLGFVCKLCGREHCADHQLPENHGCQGLKVYDRQESWFYSEESTVRTGTESAERYRREARNALDRGELGQLPGVTPDPDYDSSPDVATDGSVASSSPETDGSRGGGGSLGQRLWWRLDSRLERYRARPSAVVVDLLWVVFLGGLLALLAFVVTSTLL